MNNEKLKPCPFCDLAHPLDFSVDIRSASHVVQAIGAIGGDV